MLISASTAGRAESIRRDGDCRADQLPSCCVTCEAHSTQGCGGAPYSSSANPALLLECFLSSVA